MILENSTQRGLGQSLDLKLIITYLLLVVIGWINIYASIHSSDPASIFDFEVRSGKQAVWIATAFILALTIIFVIPPRWWEHSWFNLGPVSFQPAEISKITTSLLLATVMSQTNYKISKFKDFLLTVVIIGLPMLIILGEKETGSALVYVGFIFVLYREGQGTYGFL